jgi:hypothetical protein
VLEAGLNTATQSFQRVTDQFTRMLGFNGPQAEELARRSSRQPFSGRLRRTVRARAYVLKLWKR